MNNDQFLDKIRQERNLHGVLANLLTLAVRVIRIEEKLGMKDDEKENQAAE
jgi:hypothetical protein